MPEEYEVGYKKPPKHTRFQPGQSGNPKGPPRKERFLRGTDQLREDFFEAAERKVTVMENGRPRKMRAIQAIYHRLMQKALEGDRPSIKLFMDTYRQATEEDEGWRLKFLEMHLQSEAYLDELYTNRMKNRD